MVNLAGVGVCGSIMVEIKEILKVDDFFSIHHIKWEFKHFNIITGDMGAGKSLCIKLLKFFEDIIPSLLVLPYESFVNYLDADRFFEFLKSEFTKIFIFSVDYKERPPFTINYAFTYGEETFSITISDTGGCTVFIESSYLENMLAEWNTYIQKKNNNDLEKITPDGFDEAKRFLYADILKKFGGHFPVATIFIPASRAALAFGSNYTDNYLKEYKALIDVLPQFGSRGQEIINTILKAKIKINGSLFLESDDGRQVPIANASSGQQEIVYVLMLLDKLGNFRYSYGKNQSLFIEEPSAHLFPQEQKQTIELIVRLYNELKETERSVRFFITTHSPYVLNSLNNTLKKGALLKKHPEQEEKINGSVDIPYLYADEISACFITAEGTGETMLDTDENYLYADKIQKISCDIDEETISLSELNNELLDEKE